MNDIGSTQCGKERAGERKGPSLHITLSETPRQQIRKDWGTGRGDPVPASRAEGLGTGRELVAPAASVCREPCVVGS